MSEVSFHVDVSGAVERFTAIREKADDMGEAMEAFVSFFHRTMSEQFASEGSRLGHPWAKLSPAYAASKANIAPNAGILELTGEMLKSFTGDHSNAIVEIGPREVTIGSADPKAALHQYGTSNMPARPIIDGTQSVLAAGLAKLVASHLMGRSLDDKSSDA